MLAVVNHTCISFSDCQVQWSSRVTCTGTQEWQAVTIVGEKQEKPTPLRIMTEASVPGSSLRY